MLPLLLVLLLVVTMPAYALARSSAYNVPQFDLRAHRPAKEPVNATVFSALFGRQERALAPQIPSGQAGNKPASAEDPAVRRGGGYLGVYLGDVGEERARELNLPEVRGALVGKVAEGSPGERAGLKENDVILSINDEKIQNRAQFHRLLTGAAPGSRVQLEISREGRRRIISATLGQRISAGLDERERLFGESNALLTVAEERRQMADEAKQKGDEKTAARLLEEEQELRKQVADRRAFVETELREGKIALSPRAPRAEAGVVRGRNRLGLVAIPLSEQLAKQFNVVGAGLFVTEVRAGEAAERAGIRAGDCIIRFNGAQVGAPTDLNRLPAAENGREPEEATLVIVRDRAELTVTLRLEQR
ncbi:MAG: PDZ domain-containing protein [Blastocatellia bacterium]|nr:PDZ domain-containing protein [Blastocatellia bacterium]